MTDPARRQLAIQVGSSVRLVSFGDDTPPTRLESRRPPFETTVLALDDSSLRIALSSDDGYGWWVEPNQVEEISQ